MMTDENERTKQIKKASWFGIVINAILSILKIVVGFLAYSYALIGDGIDSFTDVITSTVTLFTAGIASRPPDAEHPYGHGRAETIATKILSFIILFAGAQLGLSALQRIITQETVSLPELPAFIVLIISIIGKLFLSIYKMRIGKKTKSSMLIADAKNMRNDMFISASVLVGLVFTVWLKKPLLDSIAALGVSVWILKTGFEIFMETSKELMDGVDDPDLYLKVFAAVNKVPGAENPHKTRIRKLNNCFIIDMDIEVDGSLTVKQGHSIAVLVEKAVKEEIPNLYDVQVHVEPKGNRESQESFGLSEQLIHRKEQ